MLHHLLDKTTKQLIDMRGAFRLTLRNPRCASIIEPVTDTVKQIDAELGKRGISFQREVIKIQPSV